MKKPNTPTNAITKANRIHLGRKMFDADAEITPAYSETKSFAADYATLEAFFRAHPRKVFTKRTIKAFRDFREMQELLNQLESNGVITIDRRHYHIERYSLAKVEVSKLKPVPKVSGDRSFSYSGAAENARKMAKRARPSAESFPERI